MKPTQQQRAAAGPTGSSDDYRRAEAVFQSACDLPAAERGPFVRKACGGDPLLESEVRSLLDHWESAPADFLAQPVHDLPAPPAESAPIRIGSYRVVKLIGRGGMGVVYEATQESPRRSVAIKLIQRPFPSAAARSRFRREAELLGRLTHPGIVRVFEAGEARVQGADGPLGSMPFLAMELVRGTAWRTYFDLALTGKADSERAARLVADVRRRVEFLAQLCETVAYAHQKGVIHRDLKPSNVLIDESGAPHVLDFGVGRALEAGADTITAVTEAGQLVGTLNYMSPEQIAGDPHAADTRSDVYALGVMAFELLTGRVPIDTAGMSLPQAIRALGENDAAPAAALNPALRGDLDAILGRALERDPRRRYGSAAELAEDLRRYLRDEPVQARPVSGTEQLLRLARRNRPWVVALSVALMALIGGGALATVFAIQAQAGAAEARLQAQRAEAIASFQRGMLAAADPYGADGQDITVREILDRAAASIADGELGAEPFVEASLRVVVGETYLHLGLLEKAAAQLQTAREILEPMGDSEPLVDTLNLLSSTIVANGPAEMEPQVELHQAALAMARRLHDGPHWQTARSLGDLAITLGAAERFDEAEPLYDEAIAEYREVEHGSSSGLANVLSSRGSMYMRLRRFDEAEACLAEAVALRRAQHTKPHPEVARTLSNYASLLLQRGRIDEAYPLLHEIVDTQRQTLPEDHPDRAFTLHTLARAAQALGKREEALTFQREALAIAERQFGEENLKLAPILLSLAASIQATPDAEIADDPNGSNPLGREIAALETRALSILRTHLPPNHPDIAVALHNIGVSRQGSGDLRGGEDLLREALEMFRVTFGDDSAQTAHMRDTLGSNLILQGRADEALAELESALRTREATLAADDGRIGLTLAKLACAYTRLGRYDDAVEAADRSLPLLRTNPALVDDEAMCRLAAVEADVNRGAEIDFTDTRAAMDDVETGLRSRWGAGSWQVAEARRVRAMLCEAAGDHTEALRALGEAEAIMAELSAGYAVNQQVSERVAATRAWLENTP